ncbi:MAG: L-aspartate oxidase, partial [Caulobacter sp.]
GEVAALEAVHGPCPPLVAARLIVDAALARQESRGGHYRSDFPEKAPPARTFVTLDAASVGLRHAAE